MYMVAPLNKDNHTFSNGAFYPCPPKARDPLRISLDMKDGKPTRYTGSPDRVLVLVSMTP